MSITQTRAPWVLLLFVVACDKELVPLESTERGPPVVPPPLFVQTCETVTATESNVTPRALIVLDRSGSMNGVAPELFDTRWNAVTTAVTSMTASHETELAFGLMLFPSPRAADPCAAGETIVAPSLASADVIASALSFTSPGGATPTAKSLRAAKDFFDAAGASDRTPTAVILATDGGPNCNPFLDVATCTCVLPDACALSNPPPADEVCLDDDDTIAAAEELHAAGVSTFVIGIPGAEPFSFLLDEIATAGGTARAGADGAPRFYPANTPDELAASLDAVRVRVEKCQRVVDVDVDQSLREAQSVSVQIGGAPLVRDQTRNEGWDITGADKIELFGTACDRAVNDERVDVAVCHLIPDEGAATSLNP